MSGCGNADALASSRDGRRTGVLSVALMLALAPVALPVGAPAASNGSRLELSGMTFVASRGPRNEFVLEAERAEIDPNREFAHLERVQAKLLGEDGRPTLEVVCERGRVDLDTNDFTASGGVRARMADGRRFSSEWLRYEHASGLASTDAPVRIEEGDRTLRGGGLRYYVREGRLRLLGGATVEQDP